MSRTSEYGSPFLALDAGRVNNDKENRRRLRALRSYIFIYLFFLLFLLNYPFFNHQDTQLQRFKQMPVYLKSGLYLSPFVGLVVRIFN